MRKDEFPTEHEARTLAKLWFNNEGLWEIVICLGITGQVCRFEIERCLR